MIWYSFGISHEQNIVVITEVGELYLNRYLFFNFDEEMKTMMSSPACEVYTACDPRLRLNICSI